MNKSIFATSWILGILTVVAIYTFAINNRIEVVAREQIANREKAIANKYSDRINTMRMALGLQPKVNINTMEDVILAIEEISNAVNTVTP